MINSTKTKTKIGIDISSHQKNIDLAALKNSIDFVIIRVGYGTQGTIDQRFERNADLCEELNIPMGFYWYSYALDSEGAKAEAQYFLDAITPYHPTMGCWFDMEDADGYKKRKGMPSNQVLQDICISFCETVEKAGYYTGVYASQSWFENQLKTDRLARFDKWIAQWPTSRGKQKGLSVKPESKPKLDIALWQFTSEGKFPGYSDKLDVNYAYKDFPNPKDNTTTTVPSNPEPTPIPTPQGTTLDLAVAVMQGLVGSGDARKNALGTRYDEVQTFINHIYSSSVETLAREVINENKYGVGDTRKAVLGDRYQEVQDMVNKLINKGHSDSKPAKQMLKGTRIRFTGTKSYSGLPLADWTHNDIFNVIEVSGDRVVIGKGSVVTAAVNARDCELLIK